MYIKINNKQYPCTGYTPRSGTVVYRGVEGLELPISGTVGLYSNDGLELSTQDAGAYLRQVYVGSTLTLTNEPEPELPEETIDSVRVEKLAQLSTACHDAIVSGVDVATEYGTEHFSLSLEDQVNIKAMFDAALSGFPCPYHADGLPCVLYSAEDIIAIYQAAQAHKIYHLTYHNLIKQWAERETDKEALRIISYGDELPADLAAQMADLLAAINGGGVG